QLINVDTTNPTNLITNGSFEVNTTGWAAEGSSTISQSAALKYIGNDSLSIVTTDAANDGAKFAYALTSNTKYTLNYYVRTNLTSADTGTLSTIQIGRAEDGSTDTSCLTAQTVLTNGWKQLTCTFTTGTTSGSPYVYIKQTDATARTFFIDGVELSQFSLLANASIEQAIAGNWAVKGSSTVT